MYAGQCMVSIDSSNGNGHRNNEGGENIYEGMSYEVEFVAPQTQDARPEKIVRLPGRIGSVEKLIGIIEREFPETPHGNLEVTADYDGSLYISGLCDVVRARKIVYADGSEREL